VRKRVCTKGIMIKGIDVKLAKKRCYGKWSVS